MDEPGTYEQAISELAAWGRNRELNALEALMWRTERPPGDSWAGVVVQVLDSAPPWERLVDAHRWAMRVVPRFAERVVEPLLPVGPPMWSADPRFDLDFHLRRVRLPDGAGRQELLAFAERQGVEPLDRARPPWVAHLIEGLADGSAAYVLHAHHVLMDGGAATQLFSRVLRREGAPKRRPPAPRAEPATIAPVEATARGMVGQITGAPATAARMARGGLQAISRPRSVAEYAASMTRVVRPPPRSSSPLLKPGPRTTWRFGTLECPLSELKAAGKAAEGTVNDAFVASLLGGLRIYHEEAGATLDDVPISMPVSVRSSADMGGNRFTGAFFSAPSSVIDPAERIRAMHERVEEVRREPALDFLNALTPVMNNVPSGIVTATLASLTSGAVLTTSSWPGVLHPVFVAGARFERMFVFGPLPGTSMCAALCSHVGTCCIAINVDGDVFGDLPALMGSLQAGLDEVLALA